LKENVATGLVLTGTLETRGLRIDEDRKLVRIPGSAVVATGIYGHLGRLLLLCGAARISSSMDEVLERKSLPANLFPNRSLDEFWHNARRRIWTWIAGSLDRHI